MPQARRTTEKGRVIADDLDMETLRLTYAEVNKGVDRLHAESARMDAEFAALPPAAGAILAVFIAFRPDDLPGVFPYLYGLALVPFLGILYISVRSRDLLDAPDLRQKVAKEARVSDELEDDARLPAREWLTGRIIGGRAVQWAGLQQTAHFHQYIRGGRILFGALIVFLALVTTAALLAT